MRRVKDDERSAATCEGGLTKEKDAMEARV